MERRLAVMAGAGVLPGRAAAEAARRRRLAERELRRRLEPCRGVRPGLIVERYELAVCIHRRSHIREQRGPVVVPTDLVFAAELYSHGLADFLR